MSADLLPPGIGLPPAAATGKFLPFDLPPAAEDALGEEDSGEGPADLAALLSSVTVLAVPLLPQPAVTAAIAGRTAEPPAPAAAAPLLQPLPSSPEGASEILLASAAAEADELWSPPGKGAAVVVAMEPALARSSSRAEPGAQEPHRMRSVAERSPIASPAPAERPAEQQSGQASPGQAPDVLAPRLAASAPVSPPHDAPAGSLTPAQPALSGSLNLTTLPAAQSQPLHELSALVDRLAAAREALAPATAALALDHAEFGELTLRFEQQQDGQLVVGLSAGNAEAHRAVAAALAAERNPFVGGDRPADQQQQNGQPRTTNGGGSLDRGSGGGGGHSGSQPGSGQTRHDAPRPDPAPQGWRSAGGHETPQGGIYA